MDKKEKLELGNRTIAKLAIAIATAIELNNNGEVIGPLTRKVLQTLDDLDTGVQHFIDYQPQNEPPKRELTAAQMLPTRTRK